MDFKTFLENFDVIAEAPGGIPQLRSLIMDLAMRGKLVPQSLEDEPASKLLTRIQNEFKELINQKKIRKAELLPVLKDDEVPFDKPIGWEWCRLGEIVRVSSGDNLTSHNMADGGKIPVFGGNGVTGYHDKANVHKPTLVIGRVGFYCGSVHITPKLAWVTDNAFITTFSENCIYIHFVYWLLKTINLQQNNSATAQPVISGGKIYSIPVPLPPLAEQKRIVEKVEELMGLCDRYEVAKQTRDNLRQKLRGSAITSLMNAETDEELDAAWAFVRDNWQNLSQHPEDVSSLRKTILELAVRGKLVPQDSEDCEAKYEIEQIVKRTKELESSGQLNKQKKPLPLSDELPYSIPPAWSWTRFVKVASIESNLVKPDKFLDYPHIAPNYIEKGTGKLLTYQTVAADKVTSPKHWFYPGQIVYSKIRPNLNKVTIVDFEGLCSADMYPISTGLYPRYLLLFMLSQPFINQATSGDNRLAMPKVNQDQLSQVLVAVPPLAEQKRIVAKVDELMQLCDQLEASLRQSQQRAESLAASTISHLTI